MMRKLLWTTACVITWVFPAPALAKTHHWLGLPAIRVIANPVNQAFKLSAPDLVRKELESRLTHVHNRRPARTTIVARKPCPTRLAERTRQRWRVGYRAHISLSRTRFPTQPYGRLILPAAGYMAARLVKLGKAQGHNWWCVLYPSLCFIDSRNGLAVRLGMAPALEPTTSHGGPMRLRISWRVPQFLLKVVHLLRHV